MSPHTGHFWPVRPWTARLLFFSPFSSLAASPRDALDRVAERGRGWRRTGVCSVVLVEAVGGLERRHPRGVQDLVGVGVADAGDGALVAQHALDLLATLALEDLLEHLEGEVVGERVGAEPGDARRPPAGRGRRRSPGSSGAGLGDVEAGPGLEVGVVDDDAGGEGVLAAGPGGQRRHLVAPADPAGPGEVDDEVQPAGVDVEELAVPGDVLDERALERVQRRVEGLQRAERGEVDAARSRGPSSRPRRSRARASTSGSSGTCIRV